MIRSFRDRDTEKVFRREFSRKFHRIAVVAKRKLDHIHAAAALADLVAVPGNRLEVLLVIAKGYTAFGSTTSGGFVSVGTGSTL